MEISKRFRFPFVSPFGATLSASFFEVSGLDKRLLKLSIFRLRLDRLEMQLCRHPRYISAQHILQIVIVVDKGVDTDIGLDVVFEDDAIADENDENVDGDAFTLLLGRPAFFFNFFDAFSFTFTPRWKYWMR